jgi:SAM-dependent methyltransferase
LIESLTYNIQEQERLSRAKNYFAWQADLVRPEAGQRIVEVGCGIGNFTRFLLDRQLVVAIDAEEDCVERNKDQFSRYANLQFLHCDVAGSGFPALKRFRPDTCICLNVLEHIEDDCAALEAMAEILDRSGSIILFVPALPALYGPADRELGHFRRYTRASLGRVAKQSGLQVKKMHYVNVVGMFGWWFNAHVLRLTSQSELQIEVFDRWVVPILSRLERVIRPPLGQSLFAVLRKI